MLGRSRSDSRSQLFWDVIQIPGFQRPGPSFLLPLAAICLLPAVSNQATRSSLGLNPCKCHARKDSEVSTPTFYQSQGTGLSSTRTNHSLLITCKTRISNHPLGTLSRPVTGISTNGNSRVLCLVHHVVEYGHLWGSVLAAPATQADAVGQGHTGHFLRAGK